MNYGTLTKTLSNLAAFQSLSEHFNDFEMKNLVILFKKIALLAFTYASSSVAFAQQVPVSVMHITNACFNPATSGQTQENHLQICHAQSKILRCDYISFIGGRRNEKQHIFPGLQLSQYQFFSLSRFSCSPTMATQLHVGPTLTIGFGISAGLIFYGVNYNHVQLGQVNDPNVANSSTLELDAGAGTDVGWKFGPIALRAGGYFQQLPRNALSDRNVFSVVPHIVGYGNAMLKLAPDVLIGPHFLYRNTFLNHQVNIQKAQSDIAWKVLFQKQKLWAMLGLRIGGGYTGAVGIQVWERHKAANSTKAAASIDFSTGFFIPNGGALNLTTAEVALGIRFANRTPDTLVKHHGMFPIWEKTSNYLNFLQEKIAPYSPSGLTGKVDGDSTKVTLTCSLDDNVDRFLGDEPKFQNGLLTSIGEEWPGMDFFLEESAFETLKECLYPSKVYSKDTLELDSLKKLLWVCLKADLRYDSYGARMSSGVEYLGELNQANKPLEIKAIIDETQESFVFEPKGKMLSHLELAVIKAYVAQERLRAAIIQSFAANGKICGVVCEGQTIKIEEDQSSDLTVSFHTLRIVTDNPNQKALMKMTVDWRFQRFSLQERALSLSKKSSTKKEANPQKAKITTPKTKSSKRAPSLLRVRDFHPK